MPHPIDNTERILGGLEEFKKWAEREFENLNKEVKELKDEIKILNHFKWKIAGGASFISAVGVAAFEILKSTHHLPWKD